ncbi:MAG: sensor histidine kinase KdpD [Coprobacillus sp.]
MNEHTNTIKNIKVNRGHLKIFFGYAAGVGKTYAMLQAAHAAKSRGVDVVVGYTEVNSRPETAKLITGLEVLNVKKIEYRDTIFNEFDLDYALKRKPELILIDELAHTNIPGSRHVKRYQDIRELLKAGIDVYTTVNVQHIESLNDLVTSVTGVVVEERIPDHIFDDADQVELVDIEPKELIERLEAGKVFNKPQTQEALSHFFNIKNLVALREIALRRCADRINKISEIVKGDSSKDYYTGEHILVCISSSPTNAKIIRTAARMASAFKGKLTALYVETPDASLMSSEDKKQLRMNMELARSLGAIIETVYGDDVAFQISEYSRLSTVSKIVVGRSHSKKKYFFSKPSLVEQLTTFSPNLDIYIIPVKGISKYQERKINNKENINFADLIKSIMLLVLSTVVGFVFYMLGFSEANIITVYILGVLLIAVVTTQRIYSIVSSIVSVLVFNFFFTVPRYTFNAYDPGYPVTFLIMFIAAFITSSLASKIKQNAKHSSQTAYRTKILLDTNQMLQKEKDKQGIITVTCHQLMKLLDKDIVFYLVENDNLSEPIVYQANLEVSDEDYLSESEQAVAVWVFRNNKHAGKTTSTFKNARCLYLAVRMNDTVYGVVGIHLQEDPLDAFENSVVLSILGESALALENERAIREKSEADVIAKNEQLRANLLRSISHDLRTPLTSISGNAGILLNSEDTLAKDKRVRLYSDIYDDSLWLINLVENLLSVTRIEDGTMQLKLSAELIDEVVSEALNHVNRKSKEHTILFEQSDDFLMAKMDARLIIQVIINIVDNAIKYTPSGSKIKIKTYRFHDLVVVDIADNGPGISYEMKPRIFDMFYTASNQTIADSRRSLGLGLALCKSIINAHGGEIEVLDNQPTGALFRFTLPIEEVLIHE